MPAPYVFKYRAYDKGISDKWQQHLRRIPVDLIFSSITAIRFIYGYSLYYRNSLRAHFRIFPCDREIRRHKISHFDRLGPGKGILRRVDQYLRNHCYHVSLAAHGDTRCHGHCHLCHGNIAEFSERSDRNGHRTSGRHSEHHLRHVGPFHPFSDHEQLY